jgi:hypothetical protein
MPRLSQNRPSYPRGGMWLLGKYEWPVDCDVFRTKEAEEAKKSEICPRAYRESIKKRP